MRIKTATLKCACTPHGLGNDARASSTLTDRVSLAHLKEEGRDWRLQITVGSRTQLQAEHIPRTHSQSVRPNLGLALPLAVKAKLYLRQLRCNDIMVIIRLASELPKIGAIPGLWDWRANDLRLRWVRVNPEIRNVGNG